MKLWKKLTAALLCAACVCSLLAAPAGAAAAVSAFSDVTDPQVGRAVEVLRTMGVVSGVGGGRYNPSGTLTRAEFCKLLILVMDRGDEVASYSSRTIFKDVTGRHWGRGYVNLAASTQIDGARLIMGVGNGGFAPDRAITYGEAVTILLRVLGYGAQANMNWPAGAVTTAASLGLDDGLGTVTAAGPITRAQAALLFCNLLSARGKNGELYAASLGSVERGTLLLSCSAVTADGDRRAVQTLAGTFRAAANLPPASFQGRRGTAVFNGDGLFLTFLPEDTESRTFLTAGASATSLVAADGTKLTLSAATPVWFDGEKLTYGELFASLNRAGLTVTVYYTAAGAVDYLYVGGVGVSTGENVMVAQPPISGNPFAAITAGATGYAIVKNGAAATLSDVRAYDVGVFDPSSNTLYISDFRLSGVYESALPNPYAPNTITVSGQQYQVLECAADALSAAAMGSTVTLLFTSDGKVAGAVTGGQARPNAIGLVTGEQGGQVTVELVNAPSGLPATLTGTVNGAAHLGQLVSVSGGAKGLLYLGRLTGAPAGALDVKARTVGSLPLSDTVRVYERVGSGPLAAISLGELAMERVPAGQVVYVGTDYAGKVSLLVLDDVTGDRYVYGAASTQQTVTDYFDGEPVYNNVTTITNSSDSAQVVGGITFSDGFGGVAPSLETLGEFHKAAGSVELKPVNKVTLSNFNLQTNRFFSGSLELPIADNVQCYNARTKTWFTSLRQCLSYSNDLTVYYDRAPELGGKVRIVVANP